MTLRRHLPTRPVPGGPGKNSATARRLRSGSDGGFATVGRQIDGQWLPFVIPAGEVELADRAADREPPAPRSDWAEKALG